MQNVFFTKIRTPRLLFLNAVVLLFTMSAFSQSTVPEQKWWITDNAVYAFAEDTANNIMYMGGGFSTVYANQPNGTSVDAVTGIDDNTYASPNDQVFVSIPDGNGGWYIGGDFTIVGGVTRNHLAQINSNGQVTTWNPDCNSLVMTLALSGNTLYVGGSFTSIGGQSRNQIAAINATTGAVTSWNPNANSDVMSLFVDGNTIYTGGYFTTIGGQSRNGIAAIDAISGLADAFNPGSDGVIYSMCKNGGVLYAGGDFTNIGGQNRNHIAAISIATGTSTSWNPNADGTVRSVQLNSGKLYVAGYYGSIGGQARNCLAALNLTTGLATAWNPNASGQVRSLVIEGTTAYVGGNFTSIGAQARNYAAAINLSTGSPTSWNPNVGGGPQVVRSVAAAGGKVYIGGGFMGANGLARNGIAAFDISTGTPTAWNPNVNNAVRTIALDGNIVYIGGQFSTVGGQSRARFAAINASSGSVTSFNPSPNDEVDRVFVSGGKLYIGGYFSTIAGQSRNGLAAFNTSTGLITSWNPNVSGAVFAIASYNNTLYIGGSFSSIGGQARGNIGAVDITTGQPTSWNPGADWHVRSLAITGGKLFAGGGFYAIAGQSRIGLASFLLSNGSLTSWDPNPDAGYGVVNIVAKGSKIYAQGSFYTIGGQAHPKIAAIDAVSGSPLPWNPNMNINASYGITVDNGNRLYVSGDFSQIGTYARNYLGVFEVCSKAPKTPGPITQTDGVTKVCPGETRRYSIADVANAYTYNWTVPTGATIVSGQGTTSIVVSFNGSYAASDTIRVRAESECGTSAYKAKIVTKGPNPAKPSVITGDYYGVCGASGKPYSVIDVPGLTYAWSFDNGNASVASGQGTSSITANFAPAYLTGALNVTGTNGCGTSPVRTRTIKAIPATPESITGDVVVSANETGVPYSTPAISGAATYTWKAPTGAHISDGVTTSPLNTLTTTANSVTVNFGTASGDVRVKATNACGYTGNFILPVSVGGDGRLAGSTAVGEIAADIEVYPNPASDQVNISFESKQGTSYSIRLYDVLGKEVMVEEGSATEGTNLTELNTSSLASGVYHLVLKGAGIDYNAKLILDK